MFRPNAKELLLLKGDGGERFMHFVDELILSEARAGGLPLSEVDTQQRGNIGDGGVDTRVRRAVPKDESGYFTYPTCWQYKAETAKELRKRGTTTDPLRFLTRETDKPGVQELIADGYAFRFCMVGDLPPIDVKAWEARLWDELRKVNPATPEPRVVTGTHLAVWAWRFPAVAAQVRSSSIPSRLLHFEKWAAKERTRTRTYVPVDCWKAAGGQILAHVDFAQTPVDVCLSIQGEAGVGKTRLVLETLADAAANTLILYTDDEDTAINVAAELVKADSVPLAIVVADECQVRGRGKINESTRACIDRLRFVCISNSGEKFQSPGPELWLEEMERESLAKVLKANFSEVPADRRSHYAEISGGFVRFAAFLCQHDAKLVAQGDLLLAVAEAKSYVLQLLSDERDREVLEILALFTRVGMTADVAEELVSVCKAVDRDPQDIKRRAQRLKDSPGFVVQAGRYFYVTPAIVARAAFDRGWRRWVGSELQPFIAQLAPALIAPFHDAVRQYGSKEVRTSLADTFRNWILSRTADDLGDPDQVSLLGRIVEIDPETYLPVLRRIVETASAKNQLAMGPQYGRTPRRTLVWLVESLAAFPELYDDCEAVAYLLALDESEPNLGNNATNVWSHLHSVFLSGSALPFVRRFEILERRTHAATTATQVSLCLKALSVALSDAAGRMLGSPTVAGRLRPSSWVPGSDAEHIACWRSVTELLAQWAVGTDTQKSRGAQQVLVDHLPSLLAVGLLEQVRPALTTERLEPEQLAKVVGTTERFLSRPDRNGRQGPAADQTSQTDRIWTEVQGWLAELRPKTLDGRLRELLSRSPWSPTLIGSQGRPTEAVASIAREVLDGGAPALERVLPFLLSGRASGASTFGVELGRADIAETLLPLVFDTFTAGGNSLLLCGYVAGVAQRQGGLSERFRDRVDAVSRLDPAAGLNVRLQAPDVLEAYPFAVAEVDAGRLNPAVLATFAYAWGRTNVDAVRQRAVVARLATAALNDDGTVRRTLLHLLANLKQSGESNLTDRSPLADSAIRGLVRGALQCITADADSDAYELVESLRHFAAFDPGEAIRLLFILVAAKGYGGTYDHAMQALLELLQIDAAQVMSLLGGILLDREQFAFRIGGGATMLLTSLPANVVVDWVNSHGTAAAEAIAHELPLPFVNADGQAVVLAATRQILEDFAGNENVCEAFLSGSFRGDSWSGSGVEYFGAKAAAARRFLGDESPCIRRWAAIEVGQCEQHMAESSLRHAERNLF